MRSCFCLLRAIAAFGVGLGVLGPTQAQTVVPGITAADLRSQLLALPVPGVGAPEYFVAPSANECGLFRLAVKAAWGGDALGARGYAALVGYDLIELALQPIGETILILKERAEPGDVSYRGLGFYVFRPSAKRRLILEVPHPRNDLFTRNEGIAGFINLDCAGLLMAGLHRNNSSTPSPCTDGTFFVSDAAHWDGHFFQAAHEALVQKEPQAISVQLHGYANPGTEDVILSEGFAAVPAPGSFVRRLEWHLEQDWGLQADIYPTETNRLGGTWNTQGRYSNGEQQTPCSQAATQSTGTFIHVEQTYTMRLRPKRFLKSLGAVADEIWP